MVVTLSGVVFFCMKYLMTNDDPFSAVNHPWQPHFLALHVLAAPLLVFSLGLIGREHILWQIIEPRRHRSRVSGIATIVLGLPMVASGYLLQVVTDPTPRGLLVWVHIVSGALFATLFLAHLLASGVPGRWLGRREGNGNAARIRRGVGGPRLDWFGISGLKLRSRNGRGGRPARPDGRRI